MVAYIPPSLSASVGFTLHLIKKPAIDLLSAQTGISVKYLTANLEEIKKL
jgi:hypothetical protein